MTGTRIPVALSIATVNDCLLPPWLTVLYHVQELVSFKIVCTERYGRRGVVGAV